MGSIAWRFFHTDFGSDEGKIVLFNGTVETLFAKS